VPERLDDDHLSAYVQDHLAGSTGGVSLAKQIADDEQGARRTAMETIAKEIEADQEKLESLMDRFGVSSSQVKQLGALIGEQLGRVKLRLSAPAGHILRYESLIMGVTGKLHLWRGLLAVADLDSRLNREELETLERRAEDQRARLEELHAEIVRETLSS
jgi:chromosome segregation ATPase